MLVVHLASPTWLLSYAFCFFTWSNCGPPYGMLANKTLPVAQQCIPSAMQQMHFTRALPIADMSPESLQPISVGQRTT